MFLRANEGGNRNVVRLAHLEHVARRHAECVGNEFDGVGEGHIDDVGRPAGGEKATSTSGLALVDVRGIDLVLRQYIDREIAMLIGHHRQDFLRRSTVISDRHAGGCNQVDAVRHAVDVFIDPVELDFQSFSVVTGCTQDTHAPSFGDFNDDIPAMGKRDQRKIDTQHIADR